MVLSLISAIIISRAASKHSEENQLSSYIEIKQNGEAIKLQQIASNFDNTPPEISIENRDAISVCPNGKILGLKYTANDNQDGDITATSSKFNIIGNDLVIFAKDKSNNATLEKIPIKKEDTAPPDITLNGASKIYLVLGSKYTDPGASVKDNCDEEISITTEGSVDTNRIGTYNIKYYATDSANNSKEITRTVSVVDAPKGKRIIYLTFDDGPGPYTAQLLDILKKHNVKATFFVTGAGSDDLLKREYNEGHAIGLHTYSHAYGYIYSTTANFFDDLYKVQTRVKNATGYTSTLIRFPGGSSNTVSAAYDGGQKIMTKLVNAVTEKGFTYYDWNIASGDAGETTDTNQVYQNVISNLKADYSVVLQHDIKSFSVAAVERIIEYGKSHGYTFAKLEPGSYAAHHGVNN